MATLHLDLRYHFGERPAAEPSETRSLTWTDVAGLALLAGLVFFNEANFRRTDPQQFTVDWQILLRLGLLGTAGLYGLRHLPLVVHLLSRFPLAWCGLLTGWGLLTAPLAVNPLHATAATATLGCTLLFIPVILTRLGHTRFLLGLLLPLLALLLASWFVYFVFPEFGRDQYQVSDEAQGKYRLGGLAHPNGTGVQAAWVVVVSLALWTRPRVSRRLLVAAIALGAVSLLATDCRTATISLAAACCVFARGRVKSVLPLYAAFSCAVLAVLWFSLAADHEGLFSQVSRTGDASEIYELNGRLELWPRVIDRIAQSPLTGFGHGCQRFVIPSLGLNWANYHAHNLLLHVTLGLGLVGGMLVSLALAGMIGRAIGKPDALPDMVTAFLLLAGIADSMLFGPVPDATGFLWVAALSWRLVPHPGSPRHSQHRDLP